MGRYMEDVPYFITVEEALGIVKQTPIPLHLEEVGLDQCHGRILAVDLASRVDDPPFDNSSMDGFACKHDPQATYPLTLTIQGIVAAAPEGEERILEENKAYRIMTGAPLPKGADSILQIEKCTLDKTLGTVTLLEAPKPHFVRKRGENLKKESIALQKGTKLTPSRVGLCATMGYPTVPVFKPLRIAIVSTGDELKQPGAELQRGEVYESNSYGLAGLVRWMGHEPRRYEAVNDTMDALRETLSNASSECDIILTSGGVSMGEYDFVRKIMEEEGDLHFWRMKIRPGSPPLFGLWNDTPLFGLPGNPVSSHVVFRMLVAPYLRHGFHTTEPAELRLKAVLRDRVKSTQDCVTLRRVQLQISDRGVEAFQPRHQGSGNLESLASADGLTLLQPGQSGEIGQLIDVLVL